MRTSMRRARKESEQRNQRDQQRCEGKTLAVSLLRQKLSIRKTVNTVLKDTGIERSRSTVAAISKAMRTNDEQMIQKILNPSMFCAGRKAVLSRTEQELIVKAAIHDAENGRAWNMVMRIAMGKVENDGRQNAFKNEIPSLPSLRQFMVDSPELTFRKKISKQISKQRVESYEHVKSFETVLSSIMTENSGLVKNPNKVWNMDETEIDCEYSEKEKVACSSTSNKSGSKISADSSGTGIHVTCVVAASASGLICPPFFIIQGKHPMSSWTDPIDGDVANNLKLTALERFTRKNWFPEEGVKIMSDKGSIVGLPVRGGNLSLGAGRLTPAIGDQVGKTTEARTAPPGGLSSKARRSPGNE